MNLSRYINISPTVQDAVRRGIRAVALDTETLVSCAPYPQNMQITKEVLEALSKAGAVPAATAVINGTMCVGLSDGELDALCRHGAKKATRQSIPAIIAKGETALTTAGAAMLIAVLAGIHVEATGGIGGVRGADSTALAHDISADLQELRQSSVAVFSCGISAFYDGAATLEYLETYGVPVIGVGLKGGTLPRVYAKSDINLPQNVDAAQDAAELANLKWNFGLRGGVLAFTEAEEAEKLIGEDEVQKAVNTALEGARLCCVKGEGLTRHLANALNSDECAQAAFKASMLACVRAAAKAAGCIGI